MAMLQPMPNAKQPLGQNLQQAGMLCGMAAVAGSVIVSSYGMIRGNRNLTIKMVKFRLITVATMMGFFTTSTGMVPPPTFMTNYFGKQPLYTLLPQPKILPGNLGSRSSSSSKDDKLSSNDMLISDDIPPWKRQKPEME